MLKRFHYIKFMLLYFLKNEFRCLQLFNFVKCIIYFQGIDPNSASFLLSIIGITNTFGRVLCGWVADFPQVNSLLLNNISLIISTLAVFATPFCHTYGAYVTMSVFFGLAICKFSTLLYFIVM